jgi:hypothetical protein
MPYCAYCGSELREQDKFCLSCGKPRIVKSSFGAREEPKKATPSPAPEPEEDKGKKSDKKAEKSDKKSEKEEKKEADKKKSNNKDEDEEGISDKETTESPAKGTYEIPTDIREQIEIRMEIELLRIKKKKVADKIDEINKLLDEPSYELDMKVHDEVNTKIKAIRQIKIDLEAEEEKLKGKLDASFALISLPTRIKVMKDQIDELKTNLKFNKIGKDVYDQLHDEYLEKLKKDMKEHNDLIVGLKTWQTRLKAERVEMEREIKLSKARFKSKEISKERYETRQEEVENLINKIESKLKVIQEFV